MLQIVPADASLRDAALTLLYSDHSAGGREENWSELRMAVEAGEVPLDDLLVALVDDRPVGAVLGVRREGGIAFVWPPAIIDRTGPAARLLLQHLAERLDARGAQFAQCLLETGDDAGRSVMSDGGFPYCTDVLLLTHSIEDPVESPMVVLFKIGYEESTHAIFADVIERTFVGSLDCPALSRIRRGVAVLEAHRGTSDFDPALWSVFRAQDAIVGVVLCVDHPDRRVREIAYLGVVPEARGRGIGRAMLCSALLQGQHACCDSFEVAVDAGNRYALEIYRRLGFIVRRRMAVHLRLQNGASPVSE